MAPVEPDRTPDEYDRFPELRSFYDLCWYGLYATTGSYLYILWATSPIGPSISFPLFIIITLFLNFKLRRDCKKRVTQALLDINRHGRRLTDKLSKWQDTLRRYCGDDGALLALIPDPAINLHTLYSNGTPVVVVCAGFWSKYQQSPELIDAALAHEAGHVVARDIERFVRLRFWIRGLAVCTVLMVVWIALSQSGTLFTWVIGGVSLAGLAVSAAWSALVVAREIQADAYAANILGDSERIRDLLLTQLRSRNEKSNHQGVMHRLASWLIQPDLRWRTTLPGLSGVLGLRVELKLGCALAGMIVASILMASLLAGNVPEGSDDSAVKSVQLSSVLYASWWMYVFIWGRCRNAGGRSLGALKNNLASLARFGFPTWLLFIVFACLLRIYDPEQARTAKINDDVFQVNIILAFIGIWAVVKCTLLSRRERNRRRPSLIRAMLALGIGTLVGGLLAGGFFWVIHLSETTSIFLALVMMGSGAHFLTPMENHWLISGSRIEESRISTFVNSVGYLLSVSLEAIGKLWRACSASWLTVSVLSGSALLGFAYFGIIAPPWAFMVSNPVGMFGNMLGLTQAQLENVLLVEHLISYAPARIGLPIVGTLAVWLLVSLSPPRWKDFHFLVVILPACLAFQITVQRTLITLEKEFHNRDQKREEIVVRSLSEDMRHKMGLPPGVLSISHDH